MPDGTLLKYGIIKGEPTAPGIPMPMGASEVIAVKSGRFVVSDGSGRLEIAGDTDTTLAGWVELPEGKNYNASGIYTCSSTEGADTALFYHITTLLGCVFRVPINTGGDDLAATDLLKSCDLSVDTNIQGLQSQVSSEDTVIIVDYDTVNKAWADIVINPAKIDATGVA